MPKGIDVIQTLAEMLRREWIPLSPIKTVGNNSNNNPTLHNNIPDQSVERPRLKLLFNNTKLAIAQPVNYNEILV